MLVAAAPATAGVDPSFGPGGTVLPDPPTAYSEASFNHLAPDGSGGVFTTYGGPISYREARHYDAEGRLDTEYTHLLQESSISVTLPDGKRVVAETAPSGEPRWRVQRVNPDGSPDPTWTYTPIDIGVEAIGLDNAGRVLLAGVQTYGVKTVTRVMRAIRLGPNGGIDAGFETNFDVTDQETNGYPLAKGIAGRGSEGAVITAERTLFGLTPTGALDPGFGANGIVPLEESAVAVQSSPDGRFMIAGSLPASPCCAYAPSDFSVARYLPNGQLDSTYGGAGTGRSLIDVEGGSDVVNTALWAEDGGVLLGGSASADTSSCRHLYATCQFSPALARLTPDGAPQTSFGGGGKLGFPWLAAAHKGSFPTGFVSLAPRPGGGAFAGGVAGPVGILAAFTSSGYDEYGFAREVVSERRPTPATVIARGIAVDSDANLMIGAESNSGYTETGPPPGALLRFHPDGAPIIGFANNGQLLLPDGFSKFVLDRRDRPYVIGGSVTYPTNTVTRVAPNGEIDRPYGDEGTVELMPDRQLALTSISVTRAGATLVTGTLDGVRLPLVFRLRTDGSPDPHFGGDGQVRLKLGLKGNCAVTASAMTGNERLYVAGRCGNRLFVARLFPWGQLDRRFGKRGVKTLAIRRPAQATAIALQGRKVLVSGWARRPGKRQAAAKVILLRLTNRGRLDRHFGTRGFAKAGGYIRDAGCGPPEEASILLTAERIALVRDGGGRPVLGFKFNGKPQPSYGGDQRIAAGRYVAGDCFPGPLGALQAGKPVLAWTTFVPPHPRPRIALQRLEP